MPHRLVPIGLALAMFACACGSGPAVSGPSALPSDAAVQAVASRTAPNGAIAPVDAASWALADRLTSASYTSDTTAALIAGLARSGIATFSDPSSPTPEQALATTASPFELLDFQAHALAVGAWSGTTWTGAELDGVLPIPPGMTDAAPASVLLASYVAAVDSPGAALSRALMAGQDLLEPATLRFPGIVLVLFVSDLATNGGRAGGSGPGASPAPSPIPSQAEIDGPAQLAMVGHPGAAGPAVPAIELGSICSATANWLQGMINRVFNALKLAEPSNFLGAIFATVWNYAVDRLQSIVQGLISTVTDAVLGSIRSVAAAITAAAEQIASILPYGVHVVASGGTAGPAFVLGSDSQRGVFTASVTAGDLPAWPAVVQDCANVAGIALPDFTAHNVPLTWGPLQAPPDPLLSPIDSATANGVTDANGEATWGFLTSHDPGEPTGEKLTQVDVMPVAVHRPELDSLRDKLTAALLGPIPSILRPFLASLIAPLFDGLQARLNKLLDANGSGSAYLIYHGKASPAPSASVSPAPSGSCTIDLPAGTYTGMIETDFATIVPPGQIDLGEHGGENDHGTGPMTVVVAGDGTLSGSFSQTMANHFEADGPSKATTDTTVIETGAGVSGTLCSLILTFASETITACKSTGYDMCGQVGQTISLAGRMPSIPMGKPTSVAGGTLTWSRSKEGGADLGLGGLSAETQSTITVTLQGR